MGVAGLVGWPFVGLLALPMAVGLLRVLPLRSVVVVGLQAAGALGLMVLLADTVMYGKVTFSPLNLIAYNVMGLGGDSTLYGTEPWWFYIANGIINLNIALPLAAALPVVIGLRSIFYPARKGDSSMSSRKNDSLTEIWWIAVAIFCPAFVWVLCMSLQAHKEERFLFPVYPAVTVCAAISLADASHYLSSTPWKFSKVLGRVFLILGVAVHAVFSVSRLANLVSGFSSPIGVWSRANAELLAMQSAQPKKQILCLGKEWFRFPSHFFVPDGPAGRRDSQVRFVKSSFSGQLPDEFHGLAPSWVTTENCPGSPGATDQLVQTDAFSQLRQHIVRVLAATRTASETLNSWNQEEVVC
mmetsp:Transcript_85452/g.227853  ORF Transcript_85452/g.227853 Transcript_85452/m.227853 type:complete len:356 (-) Transcript_85452:633-1700(-)